MRHVPRSFRTPSRAALAGSVLAAAALVALAPLHDSGPDPHPAPAADTARTPGPSNTEHSPDQRTSLEEAIAPGLIAATTTDKTTSTIDPHDVAAARKVAQAARKTAADLRANPSPTPAPATAGTDSPPAGAPDNNPDNNPENDPENDPRNGPGSSLGSSSGASSGTSSGYDVEAERQVALAATWRLDPELAQPTDADSPETLAARAALVAIDARMQMAVAEYDTRLAAARAARSAAAAAAAEVDAARAAAAQAKEKADADRTRLVNTVNAVYSSDSLRQVSLLLSGTESDTLINGMTLLEQLSFNRAEITAASEESAAALEGALDDVADSERAARAEESRADAALEDAATARDAVIADITEAQELLNESVLADQVAALRQAGIDEALAFVTAGAAKSAALNGDVAFPLPAGSGYVDNRNWGRSGSSWARGHTGNDFSVACGTPVLAATSGTVGIRTDQSWSGPVLLTVSQGAGKLTTWYAHMEAIAVTDGQQVKAGDVVGLVGSEGNSTGCHLHFEVHPLGGSIYADNVDPVAFLQAAGAYPKA